MKKIVALMIAMTFTIAVASLSFADAPKADAKAASRAEEKAALKFDSKAAPKAEEKAPAKKGDCPPGKDCTKPAK